MTGAEDEKIRILMSELEATDETSDDELIIVAECSDDEAVQVAPKQEEKKETEFEKLRRIAASRKTMGEGELSAYERMQKKKQQELDALRGLGLGANKSRFDKGHALTTTDMSDFQRNQKLAAEEERKKRLEASEGLKNTKGADMSVWERNQLQGKDEARRQQMEAREGLHRYRLSLDPNKSYDESPDKKSMNHNIPTPEKVEKEVEVEPTVRASLIKAQEAAKSPQLTKTQESAATKSPQMSEGKEIALSIPESPVHKPPPYSRVDIKFSFGLVVKSGTTDESLRESETLRKCMNGTRDILIEELPLRPKEGTSTEKFPQAYYDPSLEPTVLSIQEDTSKKPAKGKNSTRTLCKASFPIFIREEAADEGGKKRAALSLKETKATIFKALRAAVSGGNFLK